jgi:hypothetical protein
MEKIRCTTMQFVGFFAEQTIHMEVWYDARDRSSLQAPSRAARVATSEETEELLMLLI